MCNTQNYWVFGFLPPTGILKTKLDLFPSSGEGGRRVFWWVPWDGPFPELAEKSNFPAPRGQREPPEGQKQNGEVGRESGGSCICKGNLPGRSTTRWPLCIRKVYHHMTQWSGGRGQITIEDEKRDLLWSRYPAANASLGEMCGLAGGIYKVLTHIEFFTPVSVFLLGDNKNFMTSPRIYCTYWQTRMTKFA
jgi:hypothetical protein